MSLNTQHLGTLEKSDNIQAAEEAEYDDYNMQNVMKAKNPVQLNTNNRIFRKRLPLNSSNYSSSPTSMSNKSKHVDMANRYDDKLDQGNNTS